MTQQTAKCPKCNGNGKIEAFGHVANGDCFMCKATGEVAVGTPAQKAEFSADTRKKAEWILSSTPASYAKLSYGKLLKIRNFAHGGWGLQEAFPGILTAWMENGEGAFQAKQAARLAS